MYPLESRQQTLLLSLVDYLACGRQVLRKKVSTLKSPLEVSPEQQVFVPLLLQRLPLQLPLVIERWSRRLLAQVKVGKLL